MHYLVGYEIRDGESEYDFNLLVEAENMDKARQKAKDFLAEDIDEEWENNSLDEGERIIKITGSQEVPEADVEVLEKYKEKV